MAQLFLCEMDLRGHNFGEFMCLSLQFANFDRWKPSSRPGDSFGSSVSLSGDGRTLAVSAPNDRSSDTGINGSLINNGEPDSGAVYVFVRSGRTWLQQA